MIDLSKTRRLKYQLLKNPTDYARIIEQTDLAICITNQEAHYVAVNQLYADLYGYPKHELIGQSFLMVVPPENHEALKKYHDQFFVDKYEIFRRWVVQGKDGEPMEIFADADYNDKINGRPHKITFIQFEKKIGEDQKQDRNYANNALALEFKNTEPPKS